MWVMLHIWPFRICGHDSKKISREKKIWRTLKVGMINPRNQENKARPSDKNYEKQWKMFISYRGIKYVHFLPYKIVLTISHVMWKTRLHSCFLYVRYSTLYITCRSYMYITILSFFINVLNHNITYYLR